MKNLDFKTIWPHLFAIGLFVAITFAYLSPMMKGKALEMGDITKFKSMSREIKQYEKAGNEEQVHWVRNMFGGMPATLILSKYPGLYMKEVSRAMTLYLPVPANMIFLYFIGFYILMITLRAGPWLSIVGALAFGFSSYFFIIIEAGHTSKALTIGYLAPTLAGFILLFRGKYLWGGAVTAFFFALQLVSRHPQITYYFGLFLGMFFIAKLVEAYQEKNLKHYGKVVAISVGAVVIALAANISQLSSIYGYTSETIRGKSEFTLVDGNKKDGLDYDYITGWSNGVRETFSLLVPNFEGGGTYPIAKNNKDKVTDVPPVHANTIVNTSQYFGTQPILSGPVYAGAIIVFLTLLGFFLIEGPFRWASLAACILMIMLSWGDNFSGLTKFFIEYFPFYNKFRTVSMTLVMVEFIFPIIAILGLKKMIENREALKEKPWKLYAAFGFSGGLALLMWLMPGAFTEFWPEGSKEKLTAGFLNVYFKEQYANDAVATQQYFDGLESVRLAIFKADAIRSFLFVALAGVVIWLFSRDKIKQPLVLVGVIGALIMVDMWNVNKRYLNDDNFKPKNEIENPFYPDVAENALAADNSQYRVLNLSARFDQDTRTPYFHNAIGGYHPAKLGRYQDLVSYYLEGMRQNLGKTLQNSNGDLTQFNRTLAAYQILGMLNTKYVMYSPKAPPIENKSAFGNVWFVDKWEFVANADSEVVALQQVPLKTTAVVDEEFKPYLEGLQANGPAEGTITVSEHTPNYVIYASDAPKEQLAVFSEIYYENGWQVFIDDQPAEYIRVNYVLRGLRIPEGQHKIEFRFVPPSIDNTGMTATVATSSILILLLLAFAGYKELNPGTEAQREGKEGKK